MEILILWAIMGAITALIATAKNRSGFGWFILGCIFGIFAVIIIAILPKVKHAAS